MNNTTSSTQDLDPLETQEWQEAVDVVIEREGPQRAQFLITKTIEKAYAGGAEPPDCSRTPYLNSIPVNREAQIPGDQALEQRLRHLIRWNAMAMVVRVNRKPASLGGHDPQKVYAAYAEAIETRGQPTVILAKTVKGYGMGEAGEGQNIKTATAICLRALFPTAWPTTRHSTTSLP